MDLQMKLLLALFVVILAALVMVVVFYFILGKNSQVGTHDRKWTDPKFHD